MTANNARGILVAICFAFIAAFPSDVSAQEDSHAAHHKAMRSPQAGASPTRVVLPGTSLQMRDGGQISLDADLFEDRVVVVNFVFTHCTSICPALTSIMAAVQSNLDPADDGVLLLSVTVDPARDTPAQLDRYARGVGADERWWWLTGAVPEVDRTLRAFGIEPGRPEDHPPMVLVGHPAEGRWLRWVGLPAPKQIVAAVEAMRAPTKHAGGHHEHR